ncbi:GlsB/YeaQ/YmgE family stress response membrane protein [Thermomonospora umbrina]|uniref:Membrane protein YeaQ/YmgE (Transglycosylase-associated protein family) n=1 Tax=Thermomonospora umbrina TaxID=111806 RepID=A0A3D9T735_9ACTN|nr:GlsB/YeaQ/YmgE family stress response membrane protein [Thermomonospora umbrina]REF01066.1 hypothetical protein DFJ69_6665 [Thermomonospora umbrina]
MTIGIIVTAGVFGAIIGGLGRLVVPGGREPATWLTVAVGVFAAFLGAWLGHGVLDWDGGGFGVPVALLEITLAAVGVVAAMSLWPRGGDA